MTENKPIINIIFDDLNQRIKNIGEKCLNFQEENKNLKEQLTRKTQECEELKEERNEYFELVAIRTEVLAKIANKLGINTAIIEHKEIFNKIGQLKTSKEQAEQKLEKIIKIANGMHDMWINKTKYTDVYNLAEHLLECELNRIINEFDEIDEVE